ncbi:MAG TPA: DUF4249 family protein [Balneolales bacterium]|nr:DUF4249 family protein [Balneolales bacterium]
MRKYRNILLFIGLFLVVISCQNYPQDSYKQQYVVQSYMVAQQHLPYVSVATTIKATSKFSFDSTGVNDANVSISLLDNSGNMVEHYPYIRTNYPGIYRPAVVRLVKPRRKYQLHITFPNNSDVINAYTTVPDTFHHVGSIPDTVTYQQKKPIVIRTTPSYYPGRQNIYIFTVLAADTSESLLTPFYLNRVKNNQNVYSSEFAKNSSGIINQDNYTLNSDGTLSLNFPWIGVAFYGDNKLVTNAIDDNLYDFIRSQSVQTGGSTIPPGQIQNIINHVQGGIGVFGSIASDTVSTYVKRQPSQQ